MRQFNLGLKERVEITHGEAKALVKSRVGRCQLAAGFEALVALPEPGEHRVGCVVLGQPSFYLRRTDEQEPRYLHAWAGSTYLGRYKQYDLWYCDEVNNGGSIPTLAARYGEDGDYMSGPLSGWIPDQPDHPLVVARIRAEAKGLDCRASEYQGKMARHPNGVLYPISAEAQAVELFGPLQ
jgi:hypothetical protein